MISSLVNSTPSASALASAQACSMPSGAPTITALLSETFSASFCVVRYSSHRHARSRRPSMTAAASPADRFEPVRSSTICVSPEVRNFAASAPPAFSRFAVRSFALASPAPASATRTTLPSRSTKASTSWPALPLKRPRLAPSASTGSIPSGRLSLSAIVAISAASAGRVSAKVNCMSGKSFEYKIAVGRNALLPRRARGGEVTRSVPWAGAFARPAKCDCD